MQTLIERYERRRNEYVSRRSQYTETDVREDFINPFFERLGWDVQNKRGLSRQLREVVRETQVKVEDDQTKRPDYEFKLGPERKFYVEAKKPNADIINQPKAAFQTRCYGWSANLKISILTNFEDLVIYDTTTQPHPSEPASHARLYRFHYSEYIKKEAEIAQLISRDAVYTGQFDARFSTETVNRAEEAVDRFFLNRLNQWRVQLASDIFTDKPKIDFQTINEIVERFILRILFLRMCEDRGIQTYQHLQQVAMCHDWGQFMAFLDEVDNRFDSGLFDIMNDPLFIAGERQIKFNGDTVAEIIDALYFPQAPYTFAVFEPEFLGYVYEEFLHERLYPINGTVRLQPKPENENRDVVSTPPPVIERIVQDTLSEVFSGLSFVEILDKKVVDPACGSGGFLISAFSYLMELATEALVIADDFSAIFKTLNGWQLTFEKKCVLLRHCIYGIDRDFSAVEVTRFSLLVKLLEDETPSSLPAGKAILPALDDNIVDGDALVDDRIYNINPEVPLIGNPLNWGEDVPATYNCIIGNPPYLKTEDVKNLEPAEYQFYKHSGHYRSAYKQFDKYFLFLERIVNDWLMPDGYCGLVVSRKFSHIEAGKKIRGELSKKSFLRRIVDFGNAQIFPAKTTYTCLLYFSKSRPANSDQQPLSYMPINTPQDWFLTYQIDQRSLQVPRQFVSGEASWFLPDSQAGLDLWMAMTEQTVPLGTVADVFNGIQTSRNKVYVITNWLEDRTNTLTFNQDNRVWSLEKAILKPFYDGTVAELRSFYPLPKTAYVIYPYQLESSVDGLIASVISAKVMQADYPGVYAWLQHHQASLQNRSIKPEPYPMDEWYRYGRQQALTVFENRPKIVVGINSLGDKYVYDESNTLLASGGTAGECAIAAFQDEAEQSPYDLLYIHALLNHKAVEYFCRKRGSPFRGG